MDLSDGAGTTESVTQVPPAAHAPVPRRVRVANLIAVVAPFLGIVTAGYVLWGYGFNGLHLCLLVAMFIITGLGITVGYHRLFTHRSFETYRPLECLFAILGSMAAEGPVVRWAATHRRHHQKSDSPGDPHSPHLHGRGVVGVFRGAWHSHVGWMFNADGAKLSSYVPDLIKDRFLASIDRLWLLWVAVGLVIPTVVAGLITSSWAGALLGLIWGGPVRIFFVHHVTWSVNSVCHLWGSQPYPSSDRSKNNVIVGLLALGEGWHNNHHAFPTSARHGLRWWQFDMSYLVISLLALTGLAWNVKLPAKNLVVATRPTNNP